METKSPHRMCIVCRQMKEKSELVKIIKFNDQITVNPGAKANGRGCYVCKTELCINTCVKKKIINKTFSMLVSEDIYTDLTNLLGKK